MGWCSVRTVLWFLWPRSKHSLLQASFNIFHWLHFDIRGGVVLLLIVSVQSCLDPVGQSSAGYLLTYGS